MECGGVFIFILLFSSVLTYTTSHDYSSEEDENFNELKTQDEAIEEVTSKYDVTEIVVDVPNNATLGPIVVNYTIAKPLNLAKTTVTNTTESVTKATDIENKTKKNYISIFHIKAEFDKDKDNSNVTNTSGFKEYVIGLKKGIVDGFNSFFAKPILYLKSLRGKNYDVSNRLPKIDADEMY
ncbi:uncharacterized protein LOC123700326 [Colias croceus]|uniref:uncharacterized protein LOC123700326 n=1 Tax=Colias crocea TaxID=72248 RepID=UPI001E280DF8|nr:uncharacterized protein LOC123700326 [Colias croceus]